MAAATLDVDCACIISIDGKRGCGMKKTWLLTSMMSVVLAACGGGQSAQQSNTNTGASAASNVAASNLPQTKELNYYDWSDYVDPATVSAFEKANGVKVNQAFYDSNETLEAKVLTGKSGYDLVVPSLAFVTRQIKAGAYQPIDKSQIPNYQNIDPKLLELLDKVDPGNKYVVPYFWGINTVGINPDQVKKALGTDTLPENAWDLVFKPEYANKLKSCGISFLDSPSELFPLLMNYLGKDPNSNESADIKAAADLLNSVAPDVKRYSSSGYIDDLANGNLCVAIGYNGDFHIAKKRAEDAKNGVKVQALVPKQGVGVWIDSFAIPKDATNVLNALKYINWTLDPKTAATNGNFVTYAPASKPARELMEKDYINDPSIFPTDETMKNSFVMLPKSPDAMKLTVRLFQQIKAGQYK
ncbi:polyamine ABC transporter substrate-binding protein [Snodgrassella sp. CFCC 13594]|uniref:polyamine ABC transporter substrate-binding protein n=1 Tax=Snodgrassella sp. CFCC 13594 TaxID=1775559 RepID=UPI0035104611